MRKIIMRRQGLTVEKYDFDSIVDALQRNGYEVMPKSRIKLIWQEEMADLSNLSLMQEYELFMRRSVAQAFGYKISQDLKLQFIHQDDPSFWGVRRYFSAVKFIELNCDELLKIRAVAAPTAPSKVLSGSPRIGGDLDDA